MTDLNEQALRDVVELAATMGGIDCDYDEFQVLLRAYLAALPSSANRVCDEKHPFGGCDCPAAPTPPSEIERPLVYSAPPASAPTPAVSREAVEAAVRADWRFAYLACNEHNLVETWATDMETCIARTQLLLKFGGRGGAGVSLDNDSLLAIRHALKTLKLALLVGAPHTTGETL